MLKKMKTLEVFEGERKKSIQVDDDLTYCIFDGVKYESDKSPDGDLRLLSLEKQLNGFKVKSCLNCKYFKMSGMSRDMSGGNAGYCTVDCEEFTDPQTGETKRHIDVSKITEITGACDGFAYGPKKPMEIVKPKEDLNPLIKKYFDLSRKDGDFGGYLHEKGLIHVYGEEGLRIRDTDLWPKTSVIANGKCPICELNNKDVNMVEEEVFVKVFVCPKCKFLIDVDWVKRAKKAREEFLEVGEQIKKNNITITREDVEIYKNKYQKGKW